MATYFPTKRFSRDLYRNAREQQPMTTVTDADRLENDELYAKLEVIHARAELAKLVNAEQLADWMSEISGLSLCRQWHKITAQIHLERARLAEIEPVRTENPLWVFTGSTTRRSRRHDWNPENNPWRVADKTPLIVKNWRKVTETD